MNSNEESNEEFEEFLFFTYFSEGHATAVRKKKPFFCDLTLLDASVIGQKPSNEMYAKLFSK